MIALSLPEFVVASFLRYVLRPVLRPPFPVRFQRFWMTFCSLLSLPPVGVHRSRISLGGVETVLFAPKGVTATGTPGAPGTPVVLYLHGGAWVTGNAQTHAGLAGYLAKELGAPVHLLLYGLSPEHPYPEGRQDVLVAYRALVELGVEPGRIIVAGDSAGGAMVADLLLDLADADDTQPAGGVMLSPAVAIDAERPVGAGKKDTIVQRAWAKTAAVAYARDTSDVAHRILGRDPALLAAFPPIYLQYSQDELLMAEAREFGEELISAGGHPQVHSDRGGFHVIALLPGVMKRARASIKDIAAFCRQCVAVSAGKG